MSSDQRAFDHKILRIIFLLIPVFFVYVLFSVVGRHVYDQYQIKKELQQVHGEHWQEQYETKYGSLAESQQKTMVGAGAIIIGSGLVVCIYLMATRRRPAIPAKKTGRRSRSRTRI